MQCINPITIKNKDNSHSHVPCGRCEFCLERKKSEWTIRITHELKVSFSSYFITLTYDDEHLPTTYGMPTLNPKDLTLFLKRLRQYNDKVVLGDLKPKIRYYAVGEYGTKEKRPHYHAIIFNLHKKTVENMRDIWTAGQIYVGDTERGSIHYVTGYLIDKANHENEWIYRPFSRMSKGLGLSYVAKNAKFHNQSEKMVKNSTVTIDGHTHPMPRYYKDKLFSGMDKEILKQESIKQADKREKKERKRINKKGYDYNSYMQASVEQRRAIINKRNKNNRKL